MGREVIVGRISRCKDGEHEYEFKASEDRFICGRTEFTNALWGLFHRNGEAVDVIYFRNDKGLFPEINDDRDGIEKAYCAETDFVLDVAGCDFDRFAELVREYDDGDSREVARCESMMQDARIARQKAVSLKAFVDFSNLIDELNDHIRNYSFEADMLAKYVHAEFEEIGTDECVAIEFSD